MKTNYYGPMTEQQVKDMEILMDLREELGAWKIIKIIESYIQPLPKFISLGILLKSITEETGNSQPCL